MKKSKSRAAIAVIALVCLAGCESTSDNGYEHGPWVFVSDDGPDYVVNLVTSPYADDGGNIAYDKLYLKTTLPRDVLSICFPYSRRGGGPFNVESLPDEVFCDKIGFAIFYDDGKPAWRGKIREERDAVRNRSLDPSVFGKVPSAEFRRTLDVERFSMVTADVYPIGPHWTEKSDHLTGLRQKIGQYEGYDVYQANSLTSYRFYSDEDAEDGIFYVKCPASVEKSHPEFYCTASIRLNDNIGAELSFIDFRLHGGRAFLRERIAAWKSHMCEALHCNSPTSVEDNP